MTFKTWLNDTVERAASTLVQQIVLYLIVAQQAGTGSWQAIVAAVFPAIGSVILNAIPALRLDLRNYWADISYRIVRTGVVSILGAVVATGFDLFDVGSWRAAALAAGSAVLVLIKGEFARRKPGTITPASFAYPG